MSTAAAVDIAIERFDATPGDERARLLAALEAYTVALQALGVIPPSKPQHPWEDAEGAARWLAETAAHPRYSGDLWRTLLEPNHDLTLVTSAIRTRPGVEPGTPGHVLDAVRVVRAQQVANGAAASEAGP